MDKTLVLFSGGRDSFLTTCKEASKRQKVILLSFNPGTITGEERFSQEADRIIRTFGSDNVSFAGTYHTSSIIAQLNEVWEQRSYADLAHDYPAMTNCQFCCLHCQTAMWAAAIAYAKAKIIHNISSGYRSTDEFCTGLSAYCSEIVTLADIFNIEVSFPVWQMVNDQERNQQMGLYGFVPKVTEPKCSLGRKPNRSLTGLQQDDLLKYFRVELLPKMKGIINELIPIFSHIQLLGQSANTPE